MECWANSINRITPTLQLPRSNWLRGSDFCTSTYLPVLLLQRMKWFVKFSCRLAFISRTAIFDPRWNGLRSKLTVCTMRERSFAYDFPCLGRSL
jgi:hypothetical protein